LQENLQYRQEVLKRAGSDRNLQRELWIACSRDILYWVNVFGWTYDPRKISSGMTPKLPFITWEYQDEAFLALDESVGQTDVLIEKSRDMGASWICLTLFTWRWLFRPMESYLMVSRKESLVDGSGDSLFSHVDFILKGLPEWMRPNFRRNKWFPLVRASREVLRTVRGRGRETEIPVVRPGMRPPGTRRGDRHAVGYRLPGK
jgi:hypothetical protein